MSTGFRDPERADCLRDGLLAYDEKVRDLPGMEEERTLVPLLHQIEDSIRRVRYVAVLERKRPVGPRSASAGDSHFDPIKAAIYHKRQGDRDEAFWCAFLSVHFGKSYPGGWSLVRVFYDRLGQPGRWDWATTSGDPAALRDWLDEYEEDLRDDAEPGKFGNHRKYQSLDGQSDTGTGGAVESYVDWVGPSRSHDELIMSAVREADGDPQMAFDLLYDSMEAVASFGRLARFDYLTLIGERKLALAPIEPGSPYLRGATGAADGARLLFGGSTEADLSPGELNDLVKDLGDSLGLGMQVLEDALCNWKKSRDEITHFPG